MKRSNRNKRKRCITVDSDVIDYNETAISEKLFGLSSITHMNNMFTQINKLRFKTAGEGIDAFRQINKLGEQVTKLRLNTLGNISETTLLCDKSFYDGISDVVRKIEEIDFDKVKIKENGTVSYLNEDVDIAEDISNTVNKLSTSTDNNNSVEMKIHTFFKELKEGHPIVVVLITMFLLKPFYECYVDYTKNIISNTIVKIENKSQSEWNKNKVQKDIKREVGNEIYSNSNLYCQASDILKEYRFVTADYLNVRVNTSTSSRSVYRLEFGQVVRIINKDKNWTFIEYSDDENIDIKGWVYSRYLSSFK